MASLKLPRLKANLAMVNSKGQPLEYFLRFLNVEWANRIEANEASQDETIAALQVVVDQLQALSEATQAAQQAANNAQETADGAAGGGATSGVNQDPAINLPTGGAWVNGPQVDLTGVIAGNLTITGSGPQQDDDVDLIGSGTQNVNGEFRIVEIDGGETTVFTGNLRASKLNDISGTIITNLSSSDVSSFSLARANTGNISYRIDARNLGARTIFSLLLYIFVRRS